MYPREPHRGSVQFGTMSVLCLVAACADAHDPVRPVRPASALIDSVSLAVSQASYFPPLPPEEALLGGATTVFDATDEAFEQPAANLTPADLLIHTAGDVAFAQVLVPGAGPGGGLGPTFDNASCGGCHAGDGRGVLPAPGSPLESMLLRLSIPGSSPTGGPLAAPGFGDQLQHNAIPGVSPEAGVHVSYVFTSGRYGDGTRFSLRQPLFQLTSPWTGLPAGLLVSPRVAPPNFGLGLLEAIPDATLLALSDEFDRNHDGVSGRVNQAWDVANSRPAIGRFGLKANTPALRQQSAGAYNGDMGATTSLFPAESCEGQYAVAECARHAPDIDDATLDAVAFYVATLAVPARRNMNNPVIRVGQTIFGVIGCATCHIPLLQTGAHPTIPAVSNQTIRPYTDLLLHDMGSGLADNRPDFLASGREWRTAPLWGIGLTKTVLQGAGFLHDGRARTLPEAVLSHGGEAFGSREAFRLLPAPLRSALLAFLGSL